MKVDILRTYIFNSLKSHTIIIWNTLYDTLNFHLMIVKSYHLI